MLSHVVWWKKNNVSHSFAYSCMIKRFYLAYWWDPNKYYHSGQSEPVSNCNERVLHIPHRSIRGFSIIFRTRQKCSRYIQQPQPTWQWERERERGGERERYKGDIGNYFKSQIFTNNFYSQVISITFVAQSRMGHCYSSLLQIFSSPATLFKMLYALGILRIHTFKPTWLCLIVEMLTKRMKFLQPSGYGFWLSAHSFFA